MSGGFVIPLLFSPKISKNNRIVNRFGMKPCFFGMKILVVQEIQFSFRQNGITFRFYCTKESAEI
jgi:hypothetical protein